MAVRLGDELLHRGILAGLEVRPRAAFGPPDERAGRRGVRALAAAKDGARGAEALGLVAIRVVA
jgi:hypothetical protein